MADWQVDFDIVPGKALRSVSGELTPESLASTRWWQGISIPSGLRPALDGLARRGAALSSNMEMWGDAEGNRVDLVSDGDAVTNIHVRVDVRRLDARFGAALLMLVRQLDAVLVRRDGMVVEPTIGAFGAALRGSRAWRFANDPATWLAGQEDDADT